MDMFLYKFLKFYLDIYPDKIIKLYENYRILPENLPENLSGQKLDCFMDIKQKKVIYFIRNLIAFLIINYVSFVAYFYDYFYLNFLKREVTVFATSSF